MEVCKRPARINTHTGKFPVAVRATLLLGDSERFSLRPGFQIARTSRSWGKEDQPNMELWDCAKWQACRRVGVWPSGYEYDYECDIPPTPPPPSIPTPTPSNPPISHCRGVRQYVRCPSWRGTDVPFMARSSNNTDGKVAQTVAVKRLAGGYTLYQHPRQPPAAVVKSEAHTPLQLHLQLPTGSCSNNSSSMY